MRYTVVWMPQAQDELAQIWIDAADRQAVTNAAPVVDRTLRTDAHRQGRPLGGDRVLSVPPLAVVFSVSQADRMVHVYQVWSTAP
jgi:hypothetical protein